MGKICVIGAASGLGAKMQACGKGPEALVEAGVFERLQDCGVEIVKVQMLHAAQEGDVLGRISDLNERIAKRVKEALSHKELPVVIGGDHSCAVGTWRGVKPKGLLWIDAHMDAHTPETTLSGAWHGMPLAALLGRGAKEMVGGGAVFKPEQVILVGVRSFEEGEWALLQKLGVKVYFIDEVKERGLAIVLKEAQQKLGAGFGLSIDCDVVDPDEAPGVGSPAENGVSIKELLGALDVLRGKVSALEVVEYNPDRDVGFRTRELVFEILKEMLV